MGIYEFSQKGDIILHRDNISADDAANPALGAGEDFFKSKGEIWQYALVEVKLGGTNPSWNLTPLFGNPTIGVYTQGAVKNVLSNDRFIIEVTGAKDFYIKCDGKAGTSPTISVYLTPFNA